MYALPPMTRRLALLFGLPLLTAGLVACPPVGNVPPPDQNAPILKRPSKSSAIAITGDDKYVVQVNPDDDSISVFKTSTDQRLFKVPVGDEPSSVVIHPDDKTVFVANRASGTVVKVTDFFTAPAIAGTVTVGSEPTGIALSPRGDKLIVAEFAESRVSAVDTKTMQVVGFTPVTSPRAVAISNNGDQNDNDEKVVVTEFYGRVTGAEASDSSRTGAVRILNLENLGDVGTALFAPVAPGGGFAPTSTAPNQLASVAIAEDKFFVTAIAASPDGTPKFNENVFPFLLVGSLTNASRLGEISLAAEIKTQVTTPTKSFMADLVDLSLVGNSIFYLLGRGADTIQRAVLTSDSSATLGFKPPPGSSAQPVQQIDLLGGGIGCKNPIGVVTPHDATDSKKMYVNCWVSRSTTVVALDQQKAVTKIQAADPPSPGSLEAKINNGQRFYFTGRTRWSNESWSSCGSCHPDGLSDNITWRFATGPRQSISMDSTFSKDASRTQRILNWTGERDEIHDFERNTRAVSGGLGAVTTGVCSPPAADLTGEAAINLNPTTAGDAAGLKVQLRIPVKEIQDNPASNVCVKDWDDIEEFVKTIRSPKARRTTDQASVSRGRALFVEGACQNCHGGANWSLSRRFFTPESGTNNALAALDFVAPGHTKMIQAEQTNTPGVAIAPEQVGCVLRNVGTFGALNPAETATLEKKQGNVDPAQGEFAGFNIPSLLGANVGAPFLHHGQAKTLGNLFGDARWSAHLISGNPLFSLNAQGRIDLENFVFSIDASTPIIPPASGVDLCPPVFPAPK
jgi:YVTN family beta-propeller protein